MLNLDDIQSRLDRGQYTQADVLSLLGEGASLDAGVVDRLNKGLRSASDLQALFSAVESLYAAKYRRPTTAQRVAADQALTAQAVADATAKRLQQGALAAQAESDAHAQLLATAQQAADAQAAAIAAKSAVDRFVYNTKLTEQLVAERESRAQRFADQIGDLLPSNVQTTSGLGTQN